MSINLGRSLYLSLFGTFRWVVHVKSLKGGKSRNKQLSIICVNFFLCLDHQEQKKKMLSTLFLIPIYGMRNF